MILACLMSVDSLRLINISRAYEKTLYFNSIVAVFTSFIMLMSSDGHLKRISLKDLFISLNSIQFYSILFYSLNLYMSVFRLSAVFLQSFTTFLDICLYLNKDTEYKAC